MLITIAVPARNERTGLTAVLDELQAAVNAAGVEYELVVVDDASTDGTGQLLDARAAADPRVRVVHRTGPGGFGLAVRAGLEAARGEGVIIVMGDGSDVPEDVVTCARRLADGYDAVFGSRFTRESRVTGYPALKLFLNRLGNRLVQRVYGLPYNDVTNAFKGYRTELVRMIGPLQCASFDITLELPLKIVRCAKRIAEPPIGWRGRRSGVSKLKLYRECAQYLKTAFALRRWRAPAACLELDEVHA